MQWTEEQRALVKSLWRSGMSAAQIAGQLDVGVTRCAVIGQLVRMNESEQTRAHHSKRSPRAITSTRRGPVRSLKFAGVDYAEALRDHAATCEGVDFEALRPHHCRFPVAGLGLGMLYCGATATMGSYCEPHYVKSIGGWK